MPSKRMARIVSTALASLTALAASGHAAEPWPVAVQARYGLRFNGFPVGHIEFKSKTSASAYSLDANGEISVLFGAIKWTGNSNVSGVVDSGALKPKSYAFSWKKKNKGGDIAMKYEGGKASQVSVAPPPGTGPEYVPLKDEHKAGPLDPMTAIMMLTRNDSRAPCERREAVFDGKQRYDIVFTYKRQTRIPAQAGGQSAIGIVCRATYEPIAGHRNDVHQKAYAANRDAEVVLRPVPGTKLIIPYSVSIPTSWGTGSMVTEHVKVTTTSAGQIAITD